MAGRPEIRTATVADADAIAAVHVATWRAAYRGLLPQPLLDALSVERRAEWWRHILGLGDDAILVATDDPTGRVVGFIAVGSSRDDDADETTGELRAIYLHPDSWDTGLGTLLHDAGLDALSGRFVAATLWVLAGNMRARRFYERHGWQADGATKREVRDGEVLAEVRYRRSLAPSR